MPQAGVRTYKTPSRSSNSDWADKVKIAALRDRSPWMSQIQSHPHLANHWQKFQRWVEQNYLHRNADRYKYLKLYHHATQGEIEEPSKFYTQLSLLAIVLEQKIGPDKLLPRLQEGLQTQIVRNRRISRNVKELLQMLRKFEPPSKPIGGKRMTDYLRTTKELSNISRKATDPGQLEARDSLTKDSGSQT